MICFFPEPVPQAFLGYAGHAQRPNRWIPRNNPSTRRRDVRKCLRDLHSGRDCRYSCHRRWQTTWSCTGSTNSPGTSSSPRPGLVSIRLISKQIYELLRLPHLHPVPEYPPDWADTPRGPSIASWAAGGGVNTPGACPRAGFRGAGSDAKVNSGDVILTHRKKHP